MFLSINNSAVSIDNGTNSISVDTKYLLSLSDKKRTSLICRVVVKDSIEYNEVLSCIDEYIRAKKKDKDSKIKSTKDNKK